MDITRADYQTALALWVRRLDVRSPLTDTDRKTVMTFRGQLEHYRASRDIVKIGARTHHVKLVVGGVVARFGQVVEGFRQFTAFYLPGDMIDLHSAVMPVASAPSQSTGPVTLYQIPHEEIIAAAESSPILARAFWRDCVAESQVAAEWLINIGQRDARARVAHLLCELGCRYNAAEIGHDCFPLEPTQAQLGAALGLTGAHVNRMLRCLREDDLIATEKSRIEIRNWTRLAQVGDFTPDYLHLNRETSF